MSDVQDVFRAATQEVRPDPGFVDRQHRRQRRRSRKRQAGAYILAAVVGLVAAVILVRAAGDSTETKPAVPPAPRSAPEVHYLLDLETGEMAPLPGSIGGRSWTNVREYEVSPDGSMLAFTSLDADGNDQVFVARIDGTDVRQVTHGPEASMPDWSPDGTELAIVASGNGVDRSIFVLDLPTGQTRRLTDEAADVANPDWSPDGTQILYTVGDTSEKSVLRSVEVATGRVTQLTERGDAAADGVWSPDGSTIAFSLDVVGGGPDDSHGLMMMNPDGSGERLVVPEAVAFGPAWSPNGARIAYFVERQDANSFCCDVYVLDVATGEVQLATTDGLFPTWLDDDTLMILVQ